MANEKALKRLLHAEFVSYDALLQQENNTRVSVSGRIVRVSILFS